MSQRQYGIWETHKLGSFWGQPIVMWEQGHDGFWYYVNANGQMTTNAWCPSGQDWYYVGADGRMLIGWHQIDGVWHNL